MKPEIHPKYQQVQAHCACGETWTTGAVHLVGLVIGGKLIACVRLDRNELEDSCFADSRAFERDGQGTVAAMKIRGIKLQFHAVLPQIVPIEATIENVQAKARINHKVIVRGEIGGQAASLRHLPPHQSRLADIPLLNEIIDIVQRPARFKWLS